VRKKTDHTFFGVFVFTFWEMCHGVTIFSAYKNRFRIAYDYIIAWTSVHFISPD